MNSGRISSHERLRDNFRNSVFASVFDKICRQHCYTGHSSYGDSLSIGSFWYQTQPLKHKQITEPAGNMSSFSNYVPLKSQGAFDLDFKALLGCCPGVNITTFILSVNLILFSSTIYFTASIPANRLLTLIYSFYSPRKWLRTLDVCS